MPPLTSEGARNMRALGPFRRCTFAGRGPQSIAPACAHALQDDACKDGGPLIASDPGAAEIGRGSAYLA